MLPSANFQKLARSCDPADSVSEAAVVSWLVIPISLLLARGNAPYSKDPRPRNTALSGLFATRRSAIGEKFPAAPRARVSPQSSLRREPGRQRRRLAH